MERILEDVSKWPMEKRISKMKEVFLNKMGYPIDFQNPKTFSEMIQWIKLFYHDPLMTRCVDKLAFKEYIREKLGEGYSTPVYMVWHSPEEVSLKDIPRECVIKSNCSGNGEYVALIKDKDQINLIELEQRIKDSWFDRRLLNTNSFASAYYDVEPCVIVEKYLMEIADSVDDYNIFCFHGEPKFIQVKSNHFDEKQTNRGYYPITTYSLDWEYIDVRINPYTLAPGHERPKKLEEMLEISKILSKDFPFVRVDFFESPEKLYLAELTFTPWGPPYPVEPKSYDEEWGSWLDIVNSAKKEYVDEYIK